MKTDKRTLLIILLCPIFLASCWTSPVSKDGGNQSSVGPTNAKNVNDKDNKPKNKSNSDSNQKSGDGLRAGTFGKNLTADFKLPSSSVEKKLLSEYGAVFVARGVTAPVKIVFENESDVSRFHQTLQTSGENVGGFTIELQSPAMEALRKAINEAKEQGLSINPRGADSARRSYNETVGLWESRVDPALKHWVGKGKLSQADADRIAAMSPFEQVPEVLKLEESGIYFAKDLSKSIIYSVAPPGTSQHLSMLALDVKEHENERVRAILAKHKWYQTVVSDLPHFTYLGVEEVELPSLGLKRVTSGGRTFWVPDV